MNIFRQEENFSTIFRQSKIRRVEGVIAPYPPLNIGQISFRPRLFPRQSWWAHDATV